MPENKPGDTVYESDEAKKEREQIEKNLRLTEALIGNMLNVFCSKYIPAETPNGCDLKSTWEIQEMFVEIIELSKDSISLKLTELGFKTTIIGNEFKWMLRPTRAF